MRCFEVHLKDQYPCVGDQNCDPFLVAYLQDNLEEMGHQGKKRPAVLICPGGAYCSVSQREAEPVALNFLPFGYSVFVLRYSYQDVCYPTHIREVAAAIEAIHANADQWFIDTDRIAIMGFSAGAHLAAHYANQYDFDDVRLVFPDSKPVQACVLCYPMISAKPEYTPQHCIINLLGHTPSEAEIERFSCNNMVTDATPPTFLWTTFEDDALSVMNTNMYAEALIRCGVPMEVHIYTPGVHGLATVDKETCVNLADRVKKVRGWIEYARCWLDDIFGL